MTSGAFTKFCQAGIGDETTFLSYNLISLLEDIKKEENAGGRDFRFEVFSVKS